MHPDFSWCVSPALALSRPRINDRSDNGARQQAYFRRDAAESSLLGHSEAPVPQMCWAGMMRILGRIGNE
jgi:hypothetical protein